MMMTCRLLCALLVLALCCCSSVCVTGSGDGHDSPEPGSNRDGTIDTDRSRQTSGSAGEAGLPGPGLRPDPQSSRVGGSPMPTTKEVQDDPSLSSSQPAQLTKVDLGTGGPQSITQEPVIQTAESGAHGMQHNTGGVPDQRTDTALTENPTKETSEPLTVQEPRDTDIQETQSRNTAATVQRNTNVDNSTETSAATTTNTTTTTTTTTAPEAPSTTTTEAPTTTTTGAPSRLREI
ncbi:hypothetical protein MOQ_008539, partial [Trypanosoma cruzi marinkellei]